LSIIGIGIDLVYIPRIQKLYENYGSKFLNKIFAQEEIDYAFQRKNFVIHLASAFASKEAFYKSVGGYSPFSFKEIILKRDIGTGRPYLKLTGLAERVFKERGGKKITLALSHENEYTISVVIIT